MNDLLWMNIQLSDKSVSRMLREEFSPPGEPQSLLEILAETYLAPYHPRKTRVRPQKTATKRIFADTPGSYDARKEANGERG
ncbi:MAG: hypothetical protein K8I00_00955 [Candidatus Omnitrophica bacterium]|nr:hypothetical protein [Candidatus Omnitrophota bacterium]